MRPNRPLPSRPRPRGVLPFAVIACVGFAARSFAAPATRPATTAGSAPALATSLPAVARPEGDRPMPDLASVKVPPAPPLGRYPEQARLREVSITREGDVAKIRGLLDDLDRSPPGSFYAGWQMAFDPTHIDPAAALPILESKLRAPGTPPFVRAKVCLIVGAVGSEGAAELLDWVLYHDDDPEVVAMAIAGLDTCRPTPQTLKALDRFTHDRRQTKLKYGWEVTSIAERAKLVRKHTAEKMGK